MHAPEILEPRIAPATLTGKVVTYTDPDGDVVAVTISKGQIDLATDFVFAASGAGEQLRQIILDASFRKANITVAVTEVNGDGLADIGFINAEGVDLGKVTIAGDLGRILAGDPKFTTPGLTALTVNSLGAEGLTTQGGSGSLYSLIDGNLGRLTVKAGGLQQATVDVPSGSIGRVDVTGNLVGGAADNSGSIIAANRIGSAQIVGDLQGAGGEYSGILYAGVKLGNVTIDGSIEGGGGFQSGGIFSAGNIGAVVVTGSVKGTNGEEGGAIDSDKALKSVHIMGQLIGGTVFDSGSIDSNGNTKFVIIEGGIVGGSRDEAGSVQIDGHLGRAMIGGIQGGSVDFSGLQVDGNAGSVTIEGSVSGGSGAFSGSVLIGGKLASLTLRGELRGAAGAGSGLISANGAVGRVTVTGDIEGGSDENTGQIHSDSNISLVQIGGSILGGSGAYSGYISCEGTLKKIVVGSPENPGDLQGGSGPESGVIFAQIRLVSATIHGSVLSNTGAFSGAIDVDGALGLLDVQQNITGTAANPVFITAYASKLAIGTVKVGGDVTYVNILAGYSETLAQNPDSSLGKVLIEGNLTASNIVAGVRDDTGNGFGRDDRPIDVDTRPLATIGLVQVGGTATGTDGGTDHFGITAELIKKVSIGGTIAALTSGAGNDDVATPGVTTGDFRVVEVSANS